MNRSQRHILASIENKLLEGPLDEVEPITSFLLQSRISD